MRKLFLLTVAIAAIGLSSCSNKEKCWEVMNQTGTFYFWGTKEQATALIVGFGAIGETSKSESDCVVVVEKAQCWEISASVLGIKVVAAYFWGTSSEADAIIQKLKDNNDGTTFSKKSVNKNESDCYLDGLD